MNDKFKNSSLPRLGVRAQELYSDDAALMELTESFVFHYMNLRLKYKYELRLMDFKKEDLIERLQRVFKLSEEFHQIVNDVKYRIKIRELTKYSIEVFV